MKKIRICYSAVNNMGDILNKDLIEKVFDCKVLRRKSYNAEVIGIGSGLSTLQFSSNKKTNTIKNVLGHIFPKINVWGTGFISYNTTDNKFYKKKINFCAVRGNLTKKKIEKIIGKELNIPVGDGGILASYLLESKPKQKYDVGIIPHFKEKDCKLFEELKKQFKNSTIIDVQDSPINVIKHIAECKTIISSSLHGLIISDSLRVPNVHVVATNNLMGDGFKFDDYYSAYGIKHNYINLNREKVKSIDDIIKNYKVTDKMVEKMKQDMLSSFPYKNNNKLKKEGI